MTSHTNNKQAGISLMLAVLVLSAITAIAFSLATIVLIEIKSSGDVIRTEPNLYAAFAVTEEALFQYKRSVPASELNVTECPNSTSPTPKVCGINGVTLSLPTVNGQSQPIQYEDNPVVKVISAGSKEEIPMYKLDDYTKQYGKVKIDLLAGASNALRVTFRKTTVDGSTTCYPAPTDCSAYYSVNYGTSFNFTSFDDPGQYDLILDNAATGAKDLTAVLTTYAPNQTTLLGLPFIGQQVLKIVADYLGLSRTYRVQIPLTGSSNSALSNVAASSAGATATAYYSNGTPGNSHSSGGYPAASVINGSRISAGWSSGDPNSGGWNDNDNGVSPDDFQINFSGSKTISEVDVITLRDDFTSSSQPTQSQTFSAYGVTAYAVQYWNGSSWVTIPGASVSGNNLVWRQFTFSPVSTDKIRIHITGTVDGWSRLVEVEAYGF